MKPSLLKFLLAAASLAFVAGIALPAAAQAAENDSSPAGPGARISAPANAKGTLSRSGAKVAKKHKKHKKKKGATKS